LAVQGSATASKRAFLNRTLSVTPHCNRLASDIFRALQQLKSAVCNHYVGAAEEATRCITAALVEIYLYILRVSSSTSRKLVEKKLRFIRVRTCSEPEPNPLWTGPMSGPGFEKFERTGPQVRFGVRIFWQKTGPNRTSATLQ
ncbi:hypothetical protein FB451DRAFT_1036207, partial [Mycena latifolia]